MMHDMLDYIMALNATHLTSAVFYIKMFYKNTGGSNSIDKLTYQE